MAELVDAHGSGPCARKGVEVQVLSSASQCLGYERRGRSARPHRPLVAIRSLGGGSLDRGTVVSDERRPRGVDALVLRGASSCSRSLVAGWSRSRSWSSLGRWRMTGGRGARVGDACVSREAARLIRRLAAAPATDWGRWRGSRRSPPRAHPSSGRAAAHPLGARDPDPKIADAAIRSARRPRRRLGDRHPARVAPGGTASPFADRRPARAARARAGNEVRSAPSRPASGGPVLGRDACSRPIRSSARATLVALTWDPDPNVRAAAVETLGNRSGSAVGGRARAARRPRSGSCARMPREPPAHVVGAEAAPSITPLLADRQWWVRTAAKDALRGMGSDAVPSLLAVLGASGRIRARRRRRGPAGPRIRRHLGARAAEQPASRTDLRGGRRAVARGGRVARCAARLPQNRARGMMETSSASSSRLPGVPLLTTFVYVALVVVGALESTVRRQESAERGLRDPRRSASRFRSASSPPRTTRSRVIVSTVETLLAFDYPEHEVIVVNDGSTDGTLELLREAFELEPYERLRAPGLRERRSARASTGARSTRTSSSSTRRTVGRRTP